MASTKVMQGYISRIDESVDKNLERLEAQLAAGSRATDSAALVRNIRQLMSFKRALRRYIAAAQKMEPAA